MGTQGVELPVTPTGLLTRCVDQPFAFALDGGDAASWGLGRALLGFRPRCTLRVAANGDAAVSGDRQQRWHGDPFALLDRFRAECVPPAPHAQPFGGGIVVALSYDLRHWVERRTHRRPAEEGIPVLYAAVYDWLLSYSYTQQRYELASAWHAPRGLQQVAEELATLAARPAPQRPHSMARCPRPNISREQYVTAVGTALDYIAAGDVYQVNFAQRFSVSAPPPPAALFTALQHRHRMPFAAYVDGGDFVLVSNSPECFLTLQGGAVTTFPIKGTRARGADVATDQVHVRQLREDAKERAEHVMIVDLERNDLGRVCRTGSVRVADFARVHTFPSLHHVISQVTGALRPHTALAEVLRATFPGGSVTGAPKIRAMEIIDELEPLDRGFYTGAIGFIDLDGNAVFNLAIRTAVATADRVTYHAGGGIVADSVPLREYEETLLKAQPFFAALHATSGAVDQSDG
jgi:para-aminobenzoate synthetase component I